MGDSGTVRVKTPPPARKTSVAIRVFGTHGGVLTSHTYRTEDKRIGDIVADPALHEVLMRQSNHQILSLEIRLVIGKLLEKTS